MADPREETTGPAAGDADRTLTGPGPGSTAPSPSSGSLDGARFVPGTLLAGRYRIVGLLGRGGMGEVYRAEDLKLGEAVALKLLPAELSLDGAALARLHREVRLARTVAHRNVCRVFDIGEAGGLHFLSMEYIDGEDLASLLKRIGRLPGDKAVELARQICAGLAAAHEAGVLHRDMKPANVMVDGRGRAKITDFGLAQVAEELASQDVFAGTPAYMAPEQITSGEVSVRTDVYALGLVLYEMFTGERAFEDEDPRELVARGRQGEVSRPSSHVEGLDGVVEAVILRCLEQEPSKRPASALEVSAALPGGDPLAAALAAGETPSPEMVAAAPTKGLLRPPVAAGLLGGLALLVAAGLWARQEVALRSLAHLPRSPEVLEDRARTLLADLGHGAEPAGSAWGWQLNEDYVRHLHREGADPGEVARLRENRPPPYEFWYRQSPESLRPWRRHWSPGLDDPPPGTPGMVSVVLDPEGRLVGLRAVPPEREEAAGTPRDPDGSRLFAAAGLALEDFSPAEPRWTPPVYADGRRAWEGPYPGRPGIRLHVEAAHHRGLPVVFDVLAPWDRPVVPSTESPRPVQILSSVFWVAALTAGLWLVRRHLRDGRGDRRGAGRLALAIVGCRLLSWALGAHHASGVSEIGFFLEALAWALLWAGFYWTLYIAFEPFLRRRWPEGVVGWSRLLAGRLRDPLVGRDVLVGVLLGAAGAALAYLTGEALRRSGEVALAADGAWLEPLHGLGATLGVLLELRGLELATGGIFLFVLLDGLLRRKWLATAVYCGVWALFLAMMAATPVFPGFTPVLPLLLAALVTLATARFGVLTLVVYWLSFFLLYYTPTTTDLSSWHADSTVLAVVLTAALGAWGYWAATGGKPFFGRAS